MPFWCCSSPEMAESCYRSRLDGASVQFQCNFSAILTPIGAASRFQCGFSALFLRFCRLLILRYSHQCISVPPVRFQCTFFPVFLFWVQVAPEKRSQSETLKPPPLPPPSSPPFPTIFPLYGSLLLFI